MLPQFSITKRVHYGFFYFFFQQAFRFHRLQLISPNLRLSLEKIYWGARPQSVTVCLRQNEFLQFLKAFMQPPCSVCLERGRVAGLTCLCSVCPSHAEKQRLQKDCVRFGPDPHSQMTDSSRLLKSNSHEGKNL